MKQTKKTSNKALLVCILLMSILILSGCATNSTLLMQEGNQAMASGNYELAAQTLQKIPHDKKTEETSLNLAWIYWKQGQTQACLNELADLTGQRPAQADYLAALCYLRQNEMAKARRHTEKSLQSDPGNSLAIALLGEIMFLQKQYDRSIEAYQDALEHSSDPQVRLKLHYNLAMAQLLAGDFSGADNSFKKYLVRQSYVNSEDRRMAGAIAYANGDHQRAYRHWNKLDPASKKQILDVVADESEFYTQLARQR